MTITSFRDKYFFLSNFYPSVIDYDGIIYRTAEHAYQAQKTINNSERVKISQLKTAKEAKYYGRSLSLRKNWSLMKVQIMKDIIYQKFKQNEPLKWNLLATKDKELIEGNTWGDTFWGICNNEGQNYLGKILMSVRRELREE